MVVAPSTIPRKSGERQKTDKRDAASLAVLHRGGLLTAVWVPDPAHEAMRDLIRARQAAVRASRQQLSAFLLRLERVFAAGRRDQHGVVLDILVQEKRDGAAAKRFFKRLWRCAAGPATQCQTSDGSVASLCCRPSRVQAVAWRNRDEQHRYDRIRLSKVGNSPPR
jgi:hypothetical protein